MDIWSFGAIPLFKFKYANDNLTHSKKERGLVNWEGISKEELNHTFPICKVEEIPVPENWV